MNKNKIYLVIGAIIVLGLLTVVFNLRATGNVGVNPENMQEDVGIDPEVEMYLSQDIPGECSLPKNYKTSEELDEWKEHLSHHENTYYCLEYYNTNIEEMQLQ